MSRFLSQGLQTHQIPLSLFAGNRQRVIAAMRSVVSADSLVKEQACFYQGGSDSSRAQTDIEEIFVQEAFFFHLFGVNEPGFSGALLLKEGASVLFIPRLPESYGIWCGAVYPPDHFVDAFGVDYCFYEDEAKDRLQALGVDTVHMLRGMNLDSRAHFKEAQFQGMDAFSLNYDLLYDQHVEVRVHKSEEELDALRFANKLSSEAHIKVMEQFQPGMAEYQAEAIFRYHCYFHGGMRTTGYTPICGSGPNSAILHYGHAGAPNNRTTENGDFLLNDMGAEYFRYTADITVTFPVNGVFSEKQRVIYDAVFDANASVLASLAPGVHYQDMHFLAHRVLIKHLLKAGLITGDPEELFENHVSWYFMPHGLGHLLGLDTHDVGGYLPGTDKPETPILKCLRLSRPLEVGMVLTVEPGCYIIDFLVDKGINDPKVSKYFVKERIDEFRGIGGVRLEENIIITESGYENMTKVPRTVEEVEATVGRAHRN